MLGLRAAALLRFGWLYFTRLVSYSHVVSSTRFRTDSFVMRLARWNFTVLTLKCRFSPISVLVLPRATVRSTSSRSVRASKGCLGCLTM